MEKSKSLLIQMKLKSVNFLLSLTVEYMSMCLGGSCLKNTTHPTNE